MAPAAAQIHLNLFFSKDAGRVSIIFGQKWDNTPCRPWLFFLFRMSKEVEMGFDSGILLHIVSLASIGFIGVH